MRQKTSKKSSRRLQRSLPDDFKEVFHTTSKKSSTRFQKSLPHDFLEVFQKTSNGVFFHIKWSLNLRLPCKSSTAKRLIWRSSGRTDLEKTNFIVSTSEITCLALRSLLQAPIISNKSDSPRIVSFNGSINHKILESKS
ncbi:hypothetical protein IGI04_037652 [Brassica rapa subsp. trilocularis]|uniref:Uncharacterized protein n=1 Tax=Brassica rapa subsp. trilocularis TaxID=1813537 RepID=A0ABQ7LI21_BRACM|nr:hypothetical protein IGI04_037652 [Brassica rapa subsp. trilocularis]